MPEYKPYNIIDDAETDGIAIVYPMNQPAINEHKGHALSIWIWKTNLQTELYCKECSKWIKPKTNWELQSEKERKD